MPRETGVTKTKYVGPIDSPSFKMASDVHTFLCRNQGALASSGTGVINPVIDCYLQASSSPEWAGLSPNFKEFRVLALKIEFIPWNQYSKPTTTTTTPMYVTADRSDGTALSSLADAVKSASCQIYSIDNRWSRSIKMDGVEESLWTAVGASPATTNRFYLKLFATGLANSTSYADFLVTTVVQFKNQ